MTRLYRERLASRISSLENNICLGIDLHFQKLPPFLEDIKNTTNLINAAEQYCRALIDVATDKIPAIKFQIAFFEAFGHEGFKLLEDMIAYSKSKQIISILDAKRGDIASTMEAYGTMAFDRMHADALTISPYMGCDVIEPLIKWLQQGCGVYAVYLSSNPSGYKIQKTKVIDQDTVVADLMIEPMIELLKQKNLSQSLGLVIGVNYFEELPKIINKYTDSFSFLIPGIGAQGGSISTSLQSTIHANSPHLYTISRDLTGLGSTTLQEPLRNIRNIDEYCSFLERRIAIYNT